MDDGFYKYPIVGNENKNIYAAAKKYASEFNSEGP